MKPASPGTKPAGLIHIAALAQASVQQLRDAIRRLSAGQLTAAHEDEDSVFAAGADDSEFGWTDWQETSFDVRRFHG